MRYDIDTISKRVKRNQKIKRILRILFYIVLFMIMLFSLFLILVELGNSYEVPSFLNIDIYTITSDSMSPKIKTNDIIVVKKGNKNEDYKVGNIITFNRKGEIISHRINKILMAENKKAYITKGDNNITEDEEIVFYKDIIGRVIYVMPNLGNAMRILKNQFFFAGCILVLVFISYYDIRIKKKKQERKLIREKYEKKSNFYF